MKTRAELQTMFKTPVKVQKDKSLVGVALTRYLPSIHLHSILDKNVRNQTLRMESVVLVGTSYGDILSC